MKLKNSSIRNKLMLLILAACVFAVLLVFVGFAVYDRHSFLAAKETELTALADALGANCAASLTFNDQKTAADILGALSTEHHVMGAFLFDNRGELFAAYRRLDIPDRRAPAWRSDSSQFESQDLTLFRSVRLAGEKAGGIAIMADTTEFREKLVEDAKIALLVLILSVLTTYLISSSLLLVLTRPIVELAEVAGRISGQEDYTLRAAVRSQDEVGKLVLAFNKMLDRVQERDAELSRMNDDLETRVEQRTTELTKEVAERKQAEAEMRTAKDAAEVASHARASSWRT